MRALTIPNFLLVLLVFASVPARPEQPQRLIVKLHSGTLAGTHLPTQPRIAAFLGIPYAAPPVGKLRWKPPQSPSRWTGVRSATSFGPVCPQLQARWLKYVAGQEDCLYLNVWTTDPSPAANRPVLVYFHGGSNMAGYSQLTPLGPPFAQLGLVVVTANYRLGPFGFLALPALEDSEHHASGNYGLMDQMQALKWVKENIRALGGDPNQITVMGQSSGAVDICLMMASPLANGLFQRAILESGECQDTLNEDIRTPLNYNFIDTTGEASGERLVRDLGLSNAPNLADKLRQIPSDEILKAWKADPSLHFDAIVDGWVVPRQPAEIFAKGEQMRIPVLVGSNADEATVFGHEQKTVGEYKKHLQQDTGEYSDEEFKLYPVSSDAEVPLQSEQLESDEFACGAYSFATAMSRTGANSYLYYFTHSDPRDGGRLGAHHGEELFFLSSSFPDGWQPTNKDRELGSQMRSYWAQFVKTGNPNIHGISRWPAFGSHSPQYLDLGDKVEPQLVPARIQKLETILRQVTGK
jgi:para-nitrobenzyl esterase